MVQILPRKTNLGTQLGEALGGGLSQGMQAGFANYMQQQQNQQASTQQQQQRTQTAESLSNQIFGPGPSSQKNQLVSALSNLDPKDQIKGIEQLMTGQVLNQYLQESQKPKEEAAGQREASEIPAIGKLAPLAHQQLEKKKFEYKKASDEKNFAIKETEDYRNHIKQQARSAEELSPVLDQMETLIKSGKLTSPVISKIADKFGLVGLLDPSSQQFQALSIGFLKDAKNIFGSRVTNYDLQTYLDKIPRLTQTDAGKRTLIDNFRTLGEASKIKNKIKNKIIKENGGVPPLDLEEQVSKESAPELDKLSEKFNKSFYTKSKSGKVLMRHPSGALGEVSEESVKDAMKKGYSLE